MSRITSIRLSVATRDMLEALGKKGESFEDIILRLLEEVKRER